MLCLKQKLSFKKHPLFPFAVARLAALRKIHISHGIKFLIAGKKQLKWSETGTVFSISGVFIFYKMKMRVFWVPRTHANLTFLIVSSSAHPCLSHCCRWLCRAGTMCRTFRSVTGQSRYDHTNNNKKPWKNKATFNQHFNLFFSVKKGKQRQLLSAVLPFTCNCDVEADQYVVLETLWLSMKS